MPTKSNELSRKRVTIVQEIMNGMKLCAGITLAQHSTQPITFFNRAPVHARLLVLNDNFLRYNEIKFQQSDEDDKKKQ